MGTVKKLAEEVARGLEQAHPELRKTVLRKLALMVGAMIEERTPNTVELTNALPLQTDRQEMREQWLRRLLKNRLVCAATILAPFAREALIRAAGQGRTLLLGMDQTDLGNRMAILMISVRVGDRALPLFWRAEEGAANIGFEGQKQLLEQVLAWLPAGAVVSGPLLSLGVSVYLAQNARMALPPAPERQPDRRYWRRRRDNGGCVGAGRDRALSAGRATVCARGRHDESGYFA